MILKMRGSLANFPNLWNVESEKKVIGNTEIKSMINQDFKYASAISLRWSTSFST